MDNPVTNYLDILPNELIFIIMQYTGPEYNIFKELYTNLYEIHSYNIVKGFYNPSIIFGFNNDVSDMLLLKYCSNKIKQLKHFSEYTRFNNTIDYIYSSISLYKRDKLSSLYESSNILDDISICFIYHSICTNKSVKYGYLIFHFINDMIINIEHYVYNKWIDAWNSLNLYEKQILLHNNKYNIYETENSKLYTIKSREEIPIVDGTRKVKPRYYFDYYVYTELLTKLYIKMN